jgi:argininosuccinate lyase
MEKQKTWEKRLNGAPDRIMIDFVESLSFDKRLYKYDIAGSIAHAKMLAKQKLLTKGELGKIEKGLLQIEREITEGSFKFDPTYEDIHMAVEAALVDKIGEPGKKLHTGRSRNDQVATDLRLWMRDQIDLIKTKITDLQKTLVAQAEEYTKNVMPAYTHLQRAQPVTIASYLLSFVEQFERDFIRLNNCKRLVDILPLGSGAIAGSTLPLDRKVTAKQLGFSEISFNSIDAVGDRDFCAEFIFDCAVVATHLSRLSEDWIIFCSNEFGFVRIDDSFCTSSSMMPQKRNADALELIRGKTGRIYGALTGILTILKAQPSGYNRDLQEDKMHIFSAADTVIQCLDMASAVVSHSTFDTNRITSGLNEGFLDATSLAEYLVRKGVPFRQAHGIVGCIVAYCEKHSMKLADVELNDFKGFSGAIDADVYDSLGPANVVKQYATAGAAGPKQAKVQIAFWLKQLANR